MKDSYERDGYLLLREAIDQQAIDTLERNFLGVVQSVSGRELATTRTPEFAAFLSNDRAVERAVYDAVRDCDWVVEFSRSAAISAPVKALLGESIVVMRKIPFRIDLPNVVRELAVWHQDYRYVRGNDRIVTAWVPLQDTDYVNGCLMVMPGSHKLGPLDHDCEVLGKRHFPSGIFDREVRYVEMKRGDLLLFNSLLLHSSGLNISDRARLSVQARFSSLDAPTDPSMGARIPVQ